MRVDYDLGGLKASTEIPPVGFDPRQAPADVLARHDLPSRPATARRGRSMERRNGQAPIRPNPGHLRSTAIQDGWFLRVLHKLGWGFVAQHNELLLPGGERLSHPGPAEYQLWGLVVSRPMGRVGGNTVGGYFPALLQAGTTALGPGFGQAPYNSFWEYIDSKGHNSGPWSFGNMAISPGDTIYNVVRQLSLTKDSERLRLHNGRLPPASDHVHLQYVWTRGFRRLH